MEIPKNSHAKPLHARRGRSWISTTLGLTRHHLPSKHNLLIKKHLQARDLAKIDLGDSLFAMTFDMLKSHWASWVPLTTSWTLTGSLPSFSLWALRKTPGASWEQSKNYLEFYQSLLTNHSSALRSARSNPPPRACEGSAGETIFQLSRISTDRKTIL